MKKIFCIVFCAVFFLTCVMFAVGAVAGGEDTAAEGRELAAFPSWTTEDGSFNSAFFTEFDAWLTDRFSFRRQLITADAWIKEHVFATGSDQVIVGRDGFLFYADTVADFTGESAMSDGEIAAAADALKALSDYAAAHCASLITAVAPNKNTVYPDRMPAVYPHSEGESNLDRLYAALDSRGAVYADLREALRGTEYLTYHKRDTHWNSAGALISYNAVLDRAGIPHEDYAAYPLVRTEDFAGDLDGMLYPSLTLYDENFTPDFDIAAQFMFTSNYKTAMDMTITARGRGEGRALVFRDSFGSALIPYLSAAFAETRFERATPYRIDILEQFDADVVIIVIAERNIPLLVSAADRLKEAN